MRQFLDRWGFGAPYRVAADLCALMLLNVPPLETPFVRLSRPLWSAPVVGRVFRSVTYRYVARLSSRGSAFRQTTARGIRMTGDVTNFVFSGIYFGGVVYEPQLTSYLLAHLGPGAVFVDVGANCGYFSMLAAGLTGPSGRTFAFEPNPPVLRELTDHIRLNGLAGRIHTFELALSDSRTDDASLFVSPSHSGFSTLMKDSIVPEYFGTPSAVSVKTMTFDEWREHERVDHVDLMKIDVEGFEARVLAGMVQSLRARRISRVVCETAWGGAAHRMLVESGFKPAVLESVGGVANIAYEL